MENKSESIPQLLEALKRAALKSSVNELYIPLRGKHTQNPDEEPFDLAESLQGFFEFKEDASVDPKVMCLLGDAGSGKSVFSEQLHQQLWNAYRTGDPIPLWIPLPELEKPLKGAVEEVLTKQGFTEDQIAELKTHERFIFVVDGYDELHDFQNSYVMNHWEQWNAKVLITCRTQALYNKADWEKYFMPHRGEKPLALLFRKTYVAPFSKEQIRAYVRKYQYLKTAHKIAEEDFSKISGLTELITSPFMLHLAVEVLPDLLANSDEDQQMTQAKLYDSFMERWFRRQITKLRETSHVKSSDNILKQQFWGYCKALATRMHEKDVSVIPIQHQKKGGRLFGKQEQGDPWTEFFSPESELVRSACPLRRYGEHQIGFVHASFVNYFNNRAVYDRGKEVVNTAGSSEIDDELEKEQSTVHSPRINTSSMAVSLGKNLAIEEQPRERAEIEETPKKRKLKDPIHARLNGPLDTRLLADRIKEPDGVIKAYLLKILETSKRSKRFAIGAANAISALVKAGVPFNRANLSGIKIPGADISGGFFDMADLSKADLTNVTMRNVWLRKASITGSQVEGINFGEYPWFKCAGSFDISEDSRTLLVTAVSKSRGYLQLWDTVTGELIKEFAHIKDSWHTYRCLKFSPNGQIIALGTDFGDVHGTDGSLTRTAYVLLWNVSMSENVVYYGHEREVNSVAFSPDGKQVVSGSSDTTVRLWWIENEIRCDVFKGHKAAVNKVIFHLEGQRIISTSEDKTIRIWDTISQAAIRIVESNSSIFFSAFNPTGKSVAVGGKVKGTIEVWDLERGELITVLSDRNNSTQALAYSVLGDKLVSGSDNGTVRVWELTTNKVIAVLRGHRRSSFCVKFCFADQRVISCGHDNIRMWDYQYERNIIDTIGHSGSVKHVQTSPDGRFLVSRSDESDGGCTVRLWEALSGQEIMIIFRWPHQNFQMHDVIFSPDGTIIATVGGDGKIVYLWDLLNKKECSPLDKHSDAINCLQFSSKGKFIAYGYGSKVCIWSIAKGRKSHVLKHKKQYYVVSVAYSSDEKRIITADSRGKVRIWDANLGLMLRKIGLYMTYMTKKVMFDLDEKFFWAYNSQAAALIDVKSGRKETTISFQILEETDENIVYCEIIERGKRLIAGGGSFIFIFDITSMQIIHRHKFHASIICCSYHDNEFLVVGFEDGCIECWQNVSEAGDYRWQLKWTTAINSPNLFVEGLDATKVTGLSYQNRQLFMQRGAQNVPMAHRELKWKSADESSSSSKLLSPSEHSMKIGFFKENSPRIRRKESPALRDDKTENSSQLIHDQWLDGDQSRFEENGSDVGPRSDQQPVPLPTFVISTVDSTNASLLKNEEDESSELSYDQWLEKNESRLSNRVRSGSFRAHRSHSPTPPSREGSSVNTHPSDPMNDARKDEEKESLGHSGQFKQ